MIHDRAENEMTPLRGGKPMLLKQIRGGLAVRPIKLDHTSMFGPPP